MRIGVECDGHYYTLTTEPAARSSRGEPVLLIDDELTDEYRIQLSHDGCGKRSVQLFAADGTLFHDLTLPPRERDDDAQEEGHQDSA